MPRVKLFGMLRRHTRSSQFEVHGVTVRAALESLCANNQELRATLLKNDRLRPYVRVVVNGHDIELAQGLDTSLAPNDEIAIFPPSAGGAGSSLICHDSR